MIALNIPDIPFFIFFGVLIVMLPVGIFHFARWFVSTIKVRKGYYSVRTIEKNHQETEKMIKPKGNNIELQKDKKTPFSNDPEHYILRGAKKIIGFTRIGIKLQQLNFSGSQKTDKDSPSEELLNDMLAESEQFGKLQVFQDKRWKDILLIGCVIGIAIAVFLIFNTMGMINTLPTQNTTSSLIDQKLAPVIQKLDQLTTPPNITVIQR